MSSPQSFRQAVAAELRAEMARQNRRQVDLAEHLGISQNAVSLTLRGERDVTLFQVQKIADWLDVPVERFLTVGAA